MKKLSSGDGHFQVFTYPPELYHCMLKDIDAAKKYIYLETYIYDNDAIGIIFKEALIRKAKQGVEVKVLLDAWGSSVNEDFFSELIKAGGEVRFFRKIFWRFKWFKHNHRRDHRKILVIDDKFAYTGSANITNSCIDWREAHIKLKGKMAAHFKLIFLEMFRLHKRYLHRIKKYSYVIKAGPFDIVRDVPSIYFQNFRNAQVKMFRKAKLRILVETPYFMPDFKIRWALKKASKRGVDVTLILPSISDVKLMDILAQQFLGRLHKKGVKIKFYEPQIMHSKVALVDDEVCSIGSANMDYRSLAHQYELSLFTNDKAVVHEIITHFQDSLRQSRNFDYEAWKRRPFLHKVVEKIFKPFNKLM